MTTAMKRLARTGALAFSVLILLVVSTTGVASAHDEVEFGKSDHFNGVVEDPSPGGVPMQPLRNERCVKGMAADLFPCDQVDLLSFIPLPGLEASWVNDVWGWTDSKTGIEVAIVGTFEGTAFVNVTNGSNPIYLGTLPSPAPGERGNIWGDIRVFKNTAYIGTEANGEEAGDGNGIQVVDMTQFRGRKSAGEVVEANRIMDVTNSHNLSMSRRGRLYVAGSEEYMTKCVVDELTGSGNGGAVVYAVHSNQTEPRFLGCLNQDGYTHDIQCVTYHGPDRAYRDHEICVASNEDTVTVFDATNPRKPKTLSKMSYLDFPWLNDEGGITYYTHQGWLSEDHQFFFLGDELDEFLSGTARTTYIWDMRDLDDIKLINGFTEGETSIDHNMFVHRGLLYQANYTAGLTIFDTKKALNGELVRKGSFDIFPLHDETSFAGSWGTYPYFEGGKVLVTSVEEGLFVLKARAGVRRTPANVR